VSEAVGKTLQDNDEDKGGELTPWNAEGDQQEGEEIGEEIAEEFTFD
jgi:hypothetical protein